MKKYLISIALSFVLILAVIGFTLHEVRKDTFSSLGRQAMSTAMILSDVFHLSSDEIDFLLNLDYDDLLDNPLHRDLEIQARKFMEMLDIQYIYVKMPVENPQYFVEKTEEKLYDAQAGEPLDAVFLMDFTLTDEERYLDGGGRPFHNKSRFTRAFILKDQSLNSASGYKDYADRWGRYVTGFAPYHDTSGKQVGIIGVDIAYGVYRGLVRKYAALSFILLMLFSSLLFFIAKLLFEREREREKAHVDSLTGLYNRTHIWQKFLEEYEGLENKTRDLAFVIGDIDGLQAINEKWGQASGDKVLKIISRDLKAKVNAIGGHVGRWGGDEFLLIIPHLPYEEIMILFEEIKKNETEQKCSLTFGGVHFEKYTLFKPQEIFEIADDVLKKQKEFGRGGFNIEKI